MIYSFSPFGYGGSLVVVEVDLRRGIPAFDIVGLADACVKDTRERVRNAIQNSSLEFPPERALVSLSPADLKKNIPFDLPIAIDLLRSQYGLELEDDVFVMGELEISGTVRDVKGVYAGLETAANSNIHYAIVPQSDNLRVPCGMKVKTVSNLTEAYFALCDLAQKHYETFVSYLTEDVGTDIEFEDLSEDETSLDDVYIDKGDKGRDYLETLKYAMAVAVAGRHGILAIGSQDSGKTLVLQKMPQLMPKLLKNELPSVERIYSLSGLLKKDRCRSFRMPHHTASVEGICGGGPNLRPGEISLAHNGVLFLDEAAEFRTSVLQILRVPLEIKQITLVRAGRSTIFPANFQLVMAANPCPCGNYGTPDKICLCSAKTIELYWKKFGGPLLDRVAIQFWVNKEHNFVPPHTSLSDLREMIKRAWKIQIKRGVFNEYMSDTEINMYIQKATSKTAMEILNNNSHKYEFSPRALKNVLKLARTLADMNGLELIEDEIMKLAIQLHGHNPLVI